MLNVEALKKTVMCLQRREGNQPNEQDAYLIELMCEAAAIGWEFGYRSGKESCT